VTCRVIYDLTDSFWWDTTVGMWIVFGIVGTAVPAVLVLATRVPVLRSIRKFPNRFMRIVLVCAFVATLVVVPIGFLRSQRAYAALRDSYLQGHYQTLTGPITSFQDEIPHRVVPGQLAVMNHAFLWDPNTEVQPFSASIRYGQHSQPPPIVDVFRVGMPIRVRYMGDRIVRVEARASDLPSSLASQAPTCDTNL
jgi:hypothetical protein